MKFRPFVISLLVFCAIMIFIVWKATAQDTLYMKTKRVPYDVLVNKAGAITKVWYRKVKVDSGYIIAYADGSYRINGRLMKDPENKKSLAVNKAH